jgi:hypothetical protein
MASLIQWIPKYLGLVFSYIASHWRVSLGIFLSGLLLGLSYIGYHEHSLLLKERAAHQQDIANFKHAQALSDAKAEGEKNALQKESQANADEADAKYSALLAEYRANLVRYKASQSGTSQADHNQLQPTQSGDGPGTSSSVPQELTISLEDANICAVNTARLQSVHDWAMEVQKSNGTETK